MSEVTAPQAAEILGVTHPTVFHAVTDGRIPARRQGRKRQIFIDIVDLRTFAERYGYRLDEDLLKQYAS